MKILIAYASKTGTAEDCVRRLQEQLHGLDVTVADLARDAVDPSSYDMILAGGSVRFGRLLRPLRRFFSDYNAVLLSKKLGLFFCCGLSHEAEYYGEKLFADELQKHAFGLYYFGGSLRPPKSVWWEKILLHAIRSDLRESEWEDGEYTPTLPGILPETVERAATDVRREIC